MRTWLVIIVPAFGLWWAGYLYEDGTYRTLPDSLIDVSLFAASLAAAATCAVRGARRRPWSLIGALIALWTAWVALNMGGSALVLAFNRENGPQPHLVLPMLYAACASLVLGALRIAARSGPKVAAAALCLGIGLCVPVLLVVLQMAFIAF